MVTIIIYAIMAAGIVAMCWGAVMHVEGIGKAKQLAIDQPKITALTADVKTATDANATLQADLGKLADERKACSDSVVAYELETAAAKAARVSAQAKISAAKTALQEDKATVMQWALLKRPAGQTCEQTMLVIDSRLRALAVREAAERPAVDQPSPGVMRVK